MEPSSNEEYSAHRINVRYRNRDSTALVKMRQYSTFKMSIIALIFCLSITIFNIVVISDLKSLPTDLYLHEHKQLVEDWESRPFIDIVLEPECPPDYETILYRMWEGTYDICLFD